MLKALSRTQFTLTVAFHFIFVPFTIGLIIFVLIFKRLPLQIVILAISAFIFSGFVAEGEMK